MAQNHTCWKCERPLPEGKVECDYGCSQRVSDEDAARFERMRANLERRLHIDWSKVKTFEDMRLVLTTIFECATEDPDSEAAKTLAAFLIKPGENQTPS